MAQSSYLCSLSYKWTWKMYAIRDIVLLFIPVNTQFDVDQLFYVRLLILSLYRSMASHAHHHPALQGPAPYRGHLTRAQRQPPSLDFTTELFGLSITSAPIRLTSKKRGSAPNLKHHLSNNLMISAGSIELTKQTNQQRPPPVGGAGGRRQLGLVMSQY